MHTRYNTYGSYILSCWWKPRVFLKKSGLLFRLFLVFANKHIFTTNQCEKMSIPSCIRHRDSNPRLLNQESSPITTRPGLPEFVYEWYDAKHFPLTMSSACACNYSCRIVEPTRALFVNRSIYQSEQGLEVWQRRGRNEKNFNVVFGRFETCAKN